ncbi:T9SS type A sorting domain-containing protein [Bacteroides sp.]
MKKNVYKTLVAFGLCSMMFVSSAMGQDESPYAGGTGTPDDPYLIATPQQFDRMRDNRGASYKLIADLDFSTVHFDYEGGWWPIGEWGSGSGAEQRFHGSFDGDGHTIKNFYVEKPTAAHDMTFFGVVENATIERVIFENITFIGEGRMGMIGGQTENTTIRQVGAINCTVKNLGTGVEAGGFVGPGSNVLIYDCYFIDGNVECNGKLGDNDFRGDNAAALVGKAENGTTIMSSFVSGTVTARNNLGGLAGIMDATGSISGCLAMCDVTGNDDATGIGRIVGGGSPDLDSGNFALETVKVNGATVTTDNNANQKNGADVSAAELTQDFYEELGFDFDEVWKMDPSISDFPVFKWQKASSVGMKDVNAGIACKVYATVDGVKLEGLNGDETVCIYDVTGVLLNKQIANAASMTIPLNMNGICVVSVMSGKDMATFKIAK